jgi:AraC-like DNA-binding protein
LPLHSADREPLLSVTVEINHLKIDVLLDYLYSGEVSEQSYVTHEHAVHELYYIKKGNMTIECDGTTYILHTGDIYLIKAKKPHKVVSCSPDLERFHVRFCFHENDPIMLCDTTHILSYSNSGDFRDIIDKICAFQRQDVTKYICYRLKAHLGILFSYLFEYIPIILHDEEYDRITEQCNKLTLYSMIDIFLAENCGRHITVDMLAKRLKYSKVHTYRIVSECCGMTFVQKIREVRMRTAKQYLSHDTLTIDEIAVKCGYENRQGFEKAFLKYTQMSPKQYREEHGY